MEMENLKKLAVDTYNGVQTAFSQGEDPNTIIRNAFIAANNGSTKMDFDADNSKVFALLKELIPATVLMGLPDSNPIFAYAETKNGALGDKPEFEIESNDLYTVSTIAAGNASIRRQRALGGRTLTLTPQWRAIKIYEELDLILSGRIDWVKFVNRVSQSFIYEINLEIASAFTSIFNNVAATERTNGTASEASMLNLVERIEMLNPGKTAVILGTKIALRKFNIDTNYIGTEIKSDMYNTGRYGKLNGTECIEIKNALKADGKTKVLRDDEVYVIAADDKFIKFYQEGEARVKATEELENADFTQEYTVLEKWAVSVVMSNKLGVYRITG